MFDLSFIWVLIGCSSCPYTLHKWVSDLNEKLGTGSKKFTAKNPHACLFAGDYTSDYYRRITSDDFLNKLTTELDFAGLTWDNTAKKFTLDENVCIEVLCAYNGKNDVNETPLRLKITKGSTTKTINIKEIDAVDKDGNYVDTDLNLVV